MKKLKVVVPHVAAGPHVSTSFGAHPIKDGHIEVTEEQAEFLLNNLGKVFALPDGEVRDPNSTVKAPTNTITPSPVQPGAPATVAAESSEDSGQPMSGFARPDGSIEQTEDLSVDPAASGTASQAKQEARGEAQEVRTAPEEGEAVSEPQKAAQAVRKAGKPATPPKRGRR